MIRAVEPEPGPLSRGGSENAEELDSSTTLPGGARQGKHQRAATYDVQRKVRNMGHSTEQQESASARVPEGAEGSHCGRDGRRDPPIGRGNNAM